MHNVAPKLAVEEGFHGAESVCLSFVIEDDSRPSTFYLNPSSILHSQTLYTPVGKYCLKESTFVQMYRTFNSF